jgi:hypothetical protein
LRMFTLLLKTGLEMDIEGKGNGDQRGLNQIVVPLYK